MRFEKYFQEKYVGSTKTPRKKTAYTVYENPTMLEMVMALEESSYHSVRFIADNVNKKVFVWSSDAIHEWIWNDFLAKKYAKGRKNNFNSVLGLLYGIAEKRGKKFVITSSDQSPNFFKDYDWKWVDKYVSVSAWLKRFQ